MSWGIVVAVEYGQLFPRELREHRWILIAGLVLWTALTILIAGLVLWTARTVATAKCGPLLAPYAAESGAALPGRVRRDSRRFEAMILWRDLRETATGCVVIFFAVFQALHAQHYNALDWAAAALFAIPILCFVSYRFRTQAQKPSVDETVVGALNLLIYQIRRQVQLLDNLWWYIAPVFVAVILMGPIQGALAGGRGRRLRRSESLS